MAKIYNEELKIKLSVLVKNDYDQESEPINLINDELKTALEQVVQEIVGEKIIVELE